MTNQQQLGRDAVLQRIQRIEQECREEAQRDDEALRKSIEEATKDIDTGHLLNQGDLISM